MSNDGHINPALQVVINEYRREKLRERAESITPEMISEADAANLKFKAKALLYLEQIRKYADSGNIFALETLYYWESEWSWKVGERMWESTCDCLKRHLDMIESGKYD